MKKSITGLLILVITLLGSFVNFYTSNFLFCDVGNKFRDLGFLISLPGVMFSLYFVLALLYVVRTTLRPNNVHSISKLYAIINVCFSSIGLISSILAGTIYYGGVFTNPYPFPGYLIIGIIVHALALAWSIFSLTLIKKKIPQDQNKKKTTVSYVIFTIVVCLLCFFSFYRFGALLWSPIFIDLRTLYLTWPFYLSLVLPLSLLYAAISYIFKRYSTHPKVGLAVVLSINVLNIACAITVIAIGTTNTEFISVISPVLPLERLASLPIEIILQYGSMLLAGIVIAFYAVKNVKTNGNLDLADPDTHKIGKK